MSQQGSCSTWNIPASSKFKVNDSSFSPTTLSRNERRGGGSSPSCTSNEAKSIEFAFNRHGIVTSTLLTHCAKRSQQLRTSCNNRRPFFVIRQIHFNPIGLFTSIRSEFDEASHPTNHKCCSQLEDEYFKGINILIKNLLVNNSCNKRSSDASRS